MIYRFENYCLNVHHQELHQDSHKITVEPQVLDLLHYLITQRERVVNKDDLIQHVWRGRIVSDSTLSSRITTLRQALGDNGQQQRLIRTIARKGIRFVGEVHTDALPDQASEPLKRVTDKPSIAVLPLDNMSDNRELGFFADGIAQDIITTLASYPSFFVIARNSSFAAKALSLDIKAIGQKLGVRYVLEGSLRLSGDKIRATAQLIEAQTGHHVWAGRYDLDRARADMFELQDQITRATTTALAPAIAQAERSRAMRTPPASLDAWSAYQAGMWHLGQSSAEDNALAKQFFTKAIGLDPLFSGGYVGLSAVLSRSKGTQIQEEETARRAVALDGSDAEAHARLGLALLAGGDHKAAIASARHALVLCPNLAAGHGALGVALSYAGHPQEGLMALQACVQLDPFGPYLVNRLNQIALAHFFCRNYQAAADAATLAIQSFPTFPSPYRWLAAALGMLGRTEPAHAALQEAIRLSPSEIDVQIRNRPPWFRPQEHSLMREGLAKAGWMD